MAEGRSARPAEKGAFLCAIAAKLARIQNPHNMVQGVRFILDRLDGHPLTGTLAPALLKTMPEPGWAYLWQEMLGSIQRDEALLPIGRDWLAGREDKPEWAFVWQRLVEEGFEHERLLRIGRDWLAGREDKPEWSHVWRRLVEEGFEGSEMLKRGRLWLKGRTDSAAFRYVYRVIYGARAM